MKQTDDAAVLAAKEAVEAARLRLQQAEAELTAARNALGFALGALRGARLAADAKLPTAKMEEMSWSGKITSSDMVITKRSAKSISVRYPGADSGYTFREDGRGTWMQYPRLKGFGNVIRKLVDL